MVKHGALSKSHVYQLLRSKDVRVRRAAFTLLERSNPRLRKSSELFVEITRFIWDANPSYDVYHEFTKRHFQAPYKVQELINARVNLEKQEKHHAAPEELTDNTQHYERADFSNDCLGVALAAVKARVVKLGSRGVRTIKPPVGRCANVATAAWICARRFAGSECLEAVRADVP
jgi:hypothetical protein